MDEPIHELKEEIKKIPTSKKNFWEDVKRIKETYFTFIIWHYIYITSLSIIASIFLYGKRNIKYIDALFMGAAAATQSGLNTVNLNDLTLFQQMSIFTIPLFGNPIFINSMVVVVRLYWFHKEMKDVVSKSKFYRRIRRAMTLSAFTGTTTIDQAEEGNINNKNFNFSHKNDSTHQDDFDGTNSSKKKGLFNLFHSKPHSSGTSSNNINYLDVNYNQKNKNSNASGSSSVSSLRSDINSNGLQGLSVRGAHGREFQIIPRNDSNAGPIIVEESETDDQKIYGTPSTYSEDEPVQSMRPSLKMSNSSASTSSTDEIKQNSPGSPTSITFQQQQYQPSNPDKSVPKQNNTYYTPNGSFSPIEGASNLVDDSPNISKEEHLQLQPGIPQARKCKPEDLVQKKQPEFYNSDGNFVPVEGVNNLVNDSPNVSAHFKKDAKNSPKQVSGSANENKNSENKKNLDFPKDAAQILIEGEQRNPSIAENFSLGTDPHSVSKGSGLNPPNSSSQSQGIHFGPLPVPPRHDNMQTSYDELSREQTSNYPTSPPIITTTDPVAAGEGGGFLARRRSIDLSEGPPLVIKGPRERELEFAKLQRRAKLLSKAAEADGDDEVEYNNVITPTVSNASASSANYHRNSSNKKRKYIQKGADQLKGFQSSARNILFHNKGGGSSHTNTYTNMHNDSLSKDNTTSGNINGNNLYDSNNTDSFRLSSQKAPTDTPIVLTSILHSSLFDDNNEDAYANDHVKFNMQKNKNLSLLGASKENAPDSQLDLNRGKYHTTDISTDLYFKNEKNKNSTGLNRRMSTSSNPKIKSRSLSEGVNRNHDDHQFRLMHLLHPITSKLSRHAATIERAFTNMSIGHTMSFSSSKYTSSRLPYLSYAPTIGRNSRFLGLTDEEKEELGGVEYRSLKVLLKILVGYQVGFFLLGIVIFLPYGFKNHMRSYVESCGVSPAWWSFFTQNMAFTDSGFTLTPDSMQSFNKSIYILLWMSVLIIAGNTGFPVLLRFIIWISSAFSPSEGALYESLRFLLDHPRRCFTLLFPSVATWWLFTILVALNLIDLIMFIILDFNNAIIKPLPKGIRVLDGFFQAVCSRTAGFTVANLSLLHPAIQVSYMIMMYVSVYPVAISIRRTNVYEEQALGVEEDDEEMDAMAQNGEAHHSFVSAHLRRQLSYDLWYVFLGLFIICIIEGGRLSDPNDPSFNIFTVLFEIVSAYCTVGLSLGYPGVNPSFSYEFRTLSKLVIIAMMIRGRHRGLPHKIDRAVMLSSLHQNLTRTGTDSTHPRHRIRRYRTGEFNRFASLNGSNTSNSSRQGIRDLFHDKIYNRSFGKNDSINYGDEKKNEVFSNQDQNDFSYSGYQYETPTVRHVSNGSSSSGNNIYKNNGGLTGIMINSHSDAENNKNDNYTINENNDINNHNIVNKDMNSGNNIATTTTANLSSGGENLSRRTFKTTASS